VDLLGVSLGIGDHFEASSRRESSLLRSVRVSLALSSGHLLHHDRDGSRLVLRLPLSLSSVELGVVVSLNFT
jgi:hypothetical protein